MKEKDSVIASDLLRLCIRCTSRFYDDLDRFYIDFTLTKTNLDLYKSFYLGGSEFISRRVSGYLRDIELSMWDSRIVHPLMHFHLQDLLL